MLPRPTSPVAAIFPTRAESMAQPYSFQCVPPTGWVDYQIQLGDTLAQVAERAGVSVEELALANCLSVDALVPFSSLKVPSAIVVALAGEARPSAPAVSCGLPRGWVAYTVRAGDTLFALSMQTGVRVAQNSACELHGREHNDSHRSATVPAFHPCPAAGSYGGADAYPTATYRAAPSRADQPTGTSTGANRSTCANGTAGSY